MITKLICCIAIALFLSTFRTQAASAERKLTLTLSGFFQDESGFGDEVAVPFRITTKDVLEEISLATGSNVTDGVLLVIESIGEENSSTRIVARTSTVELDVTEFFKIDQGNDVRTTKYSGDALKSATFYAVDQFLFSTLSANGVELKLQGFTKETQKTAAKKIGTDQFSVVSTSTKSDGNGELRSFDGSIAPVKGSITVGSPKFVP